MSCMCRDDGCQVFSLNNCHMALYGTSFGGERVVTQADFWGENVKPTRAAIKFSRTFSTRQPFLQTDVVGSFPMESCHIGIDNEFFFSLILYMFNFKHLGKMISTCPVTCAFPSTTFCFLSSLEFPPLVPYSSTFPDSGNFFLPIVTMFCWDPCLVFGVSPLSFIV